MRDFITKSQLFKRLSRLHQCEEGMKTIEVVALLAVAAMILAVILRFWYIIQNWFVENYFDATDDW